MKLIGMLDSPYVRRVAISMHCLELPFEHQSLSVFRNFADFEYINPVVKAPTLVCDNGQTLMDSSLILEYAQALAYPKTLVPTKPSQLQLHLHVIGLGLAACEKSVQIVYEHNLRPSEKLHQPWLLRVTGQLLAAYQALEQVLAQHPDQFTITPSTPNHAVTQAGITTAVAWHFTQEMLPSVVPATQFPKLHAFTQQAKQHPAFLIAPHGDATYPVAP